MTATITPSRIGAAATPTNAVATTAAPIFIVGYIHTGTSLLKTILRKDPTLFAAAGETHFFQDLVKIRAEFPDLSRDEVLREYVLFLIKLAYLGFKRAHQERAAYSLDDFGLTEAQLDRLYGFGLLEQVDSWIRLTERGRLLGNEVFERWKAVWTTRLGLLRRMSGCVRDGGF